jgi:hypothetical protein
MKYPVFEQPCADMPPPAHDGGFIIILCLLILAVLSLSAVYALKMSITETAILRNDRIHVADSYLAEAGLIETYENPKVWLASNLLLSPDNQGVCWEIGIDDAQGGFLGTVRVDARSIVDSKEPVLNWTDTSGATVECPGEYANDVPAMPHTRKVKGGGYSATALVQRNFAVTVTSPGGNTRIQSGGYKLFPATD